VRVLGLIVEYNPFHNGHLYHLKKSVELINPDYTVAVMSGNFVQRGEPAIVDKFARTQMALSYGADVVFELPFVYCVQDAGGFACGSVGVLHRTGAVTDIVFGSESSDIGILNEISGILSSQPQEYTIILKKYLKEGLSFPNARKYAILDYLSSQSYPIENIQLLEKSNDILGLEYLNYLKQYGSSIQAHCIARQGSSYNDETVTNHLASATAVRNIIKEENIEFLKELIPEKSFEIILNEFKKGKGPVFFDSMREIILSKIRLMNKNDLLKIYGIKEGLEDRFYNYSRRSMDLECLLKNLKTKRFTYSRLKRALVHILFNLSEKEIKTYNSQGPQYLRVLGFNTKGKELLAHIKKKSRYPLIPTASQYYQIYKYLLKNQNDPDKKYDSDPIIYMDQINRDFDASNIYSLLYPEKEHAMFEPDKKNQIIIMEEKDEKTSHY